MTIQLNKRALLKLSGNDAESFLQNQLSNDINQLDNLSVQLSAYCQHQGKILVLFWVMRDGDDFLLSFPSDLLETIKPRLSMFVLMSDVTISDVSDQYKQLGLMNEELDNSYVLNDRMSLLVTKTADDSMTTTDPQDAWDKACIDAMLPEVSLATSETFVPQMLNLDINEIGVNFSKGCYPGQEVVARLHYLGKAKRRLFAFKSDTVLKVGDGLYCSRSKSAKASGIVVFQVKCKADYYCLATLEVAHKNDKINLNNAEGPILTRIDND